MKSKYSIILLIFISITGCVGYSSTGVLGTGVSIAMDPRTIGTQIDDSLMQKNLRAKLILMDKGYFLNVKTKVESRREGDPPILLSSPQKAFEELNWKPKYSTINQIISDAWRWYKKLNL